ncbi:MAG: T9SS type A sorting domain-containing protein [Chitinophagaceae bacterium]|nr:T9SS type A sorting domain-containing protein [Chitinophagaceae bacterium]MBL0057374.1 T9SS type A sorting domain-containing protein [Chitinophagaceae bacterium]
MNKTIYIFIFLIGFAVTSFAQAKVTSSGDATAKFIKVYPIPATTVINFDFQQGYDKSYTFQIYNFVGIKVFETKTTSSQFSLSLAEFFRGIYFYRLLDKNGKFIESQRFQVVK